MKKVIIAIVVIVLAVLGYYWYQGQTGGKISDTASTSIAISDEFGSL